MNAVSPATLSVECCPVCASTDREFLFDGLDRLYGLPGRFPLVRCARCAAAYLASRPVDLMQYYPFERYNAYRAARSSSGPRHWWRRYGLLRLRQLLESLKPDGGSLLDVGCGTGDFLVVMNDLARWRVSGLEPNAAAVRAAADGRDLTVFEGELPRPEWPGGQYDAVTLWHVLEHTGDPAAVLAEVRRLLKPDGALVLSLPVADSLEAAWFGEYWAGYDVPRHLVTFTRTGLQNLVEQAGFKVTEQRGVVQGLASLRLSLGLWLAGKRFLPPAFRAFALWLLLPPLFILMQLFGRGRPGVAVFVARPRTRVA